MNLPNFAHRLLAGASLLAAATSLAAQGTYAQYGEVVAAVGDAIPAAIPGVTPALGSTFNATGNFDFPIMDQNGVILFRGRMVGGTVSGADDRAYFLGRSAQDLRMVVRAGDQAPGCPVGTLLRSSSATAGSVGLIGAPRISPFNQFLFFQSSLYDPVTPTNTIATNDSALFWGPAGSIQLLAREGDPVPFLGTGETYGPFLQLSLQYAQINSSGTVVFEGQLLGGSSTTANDGYIAVGGPSGLQIVSREGDVWPGGEVVMPMSGATQMAFNKQINAAGHVLYEVRFSTTTGTATTANDRALAVWISGSGGTILAREGQQAPGLPVGVLFSNPALSWSVNSLSNAFTNAGNTMLNCQLDGGGTTVGVDDYAVYYGNLSGLNPVIRRGDACPGLPGVTFGIVGNTSMACDDAGHVAFISSLGGAVATTSDSSLWFGTIGNLQMLAREGDPVPGYPGWMFQSISAGTNSPSMNDRGCVLMNLGITDGTNFKNVLFGYTPQHGLHKQLEINGADSVTTAAGTGVITSLSSGQGFNSGDGGQSHFNANGDFVFKPGAAAPVTAAIVRGHLGSMVATPATVPAAGGAAQTFHLDAGPSHAFQWHWIVASASGTRPGFLSPIGTQTIPLNFDAWTQLSIDLADTVVWGNTLWFTDAQGKSTATFTLPPGVPGMLGLTLHHAALLFDNTLTSTHATEASALTFY
ncbi:MAG: hypothetical protein JNK15_21090 [Planctomycetes bacterium]|nr:hypothetical protein [Planctomycetota bacterium]